METKLFGKVVGRLGNELVNVIEDNIVLTNYDLSNNISRSLETRSSIIQEINEIDKRQLNNLDNQNIILENSITNKEAALALNNINTIDVITQLFTNDQNSTVLNDEYMNSLRNNAKKRRKEKNETLFIQIVEYWSILAGVSIFVYLIETYPFRLN